MQGSRTSRPSQRKENGMRAIDCKAPDAHEQDFHFTGQDDEELFSQLTQHAAQYHTSMTDEAIRQAISENAYDE
jgi:hypothetical protein